MTTLFFCSFPICRIYRDRSFHCNVCNVCLDKRLKGKHKCRPVSQQNKPHISLQVKHILVFRSTASECSILFWQHSYYKLLNPTITIIIIIINITRNQSSILQPYTLFQNGHHFSVLLFSCRLALVASFLNSKFKRVFSLKVIPQK